MSLFKERQKVFDKVLGQEVGDVLGQGHGKEGKDLSKIDEGGLKGHLVALLLVAQK